MREAELYIIIVFAGISLIIAGMLLLFLAMLSSGRESRVEGGGVVIIGPLPIVFGTSTRITIALLVLAILLTISTLIAFILFNNRGLLS